MWGMFECTIALFAPTVFKKYTDKKSGICPPPGVKRPTFHRPVVSTIFGTGFYFGSLYVHSKNHQEFLIAKLSQEAQDLQLNETERDSKKRILDVWKAIHPAQLTLFSMSYHETASNPGILMKNPMQMASAHPHAVQFFVHLIIPARLRMSGNQVARRVTMVQDPVSRSSLTIGYGSHCLIKICKHLTWGVYFRWRLSVIVNTRSSGGSGLGRLLGMSPSVEIFKLVV